MSFRLDLCIKSDYFFLVKDKIKWFLFNLSSVEHEKNPCLVMMGFENF